MQTSSRALMVVALVTAAGACAGDTQVTGLRQREGGNVPLRPNAGGVTGEHVVRGRIVGVDSAHGGEGYMPVAGAAVQVVLLAREPASGTDSSSVSPTRTPMGVTTSDAQGRFALDGVPSGQYALEVSTPADSPYRGGTAYSVAFAPGATGEALVYLYRYRR